MFRKPRVDASEGSDHTLGRPPTPPDTPIKTPFSLAVKPSVPAPKMPTKVSAKNTPLPVIGRQGPPPRKSASTPKGKKDGKPNSSILSFFKKSEDGGNEADGLFIKERGNASFGSGIGDDHTTQLIPSGEERFNEFSSPAKRRKTCHSAEESDGSGSVKDVEGGKNKRSIASMAKAGPFMEESDSEEDEVSSATTPSSQGFVSANPTRTKDNGSDLETPCEQPKAPEPPTLIKEETSYVPDFDEFAEFGDEFDEDLYEEGDEHRERRFMEEQAQLEAEAAAMNDGGELTDSAEELPQAQSTSNEAACPICNGSLAGISEQEAVVHVNHCLDGNPTPLPKSKIKVEQDASLQTNDKPRAQFKRPVRPAKSGQANPFVIGETQEVTGGSAFTRLMSGHAEDAAWAEAAASEHASRGKFAYQRTCPFYKIMPGLFICVDAFRYGAVAGCQAYFLSHFHSDHYVGLTSTWCHGPIYCSRVTGNLVRQQLRVDPKYVVDLEFEETVEVPNTKGVKVTMISANHCPGSSLFLFEKVIGKKTNGGARLQRILHCGDFRACSMHVRHPLLMPDVQDKISGKKEEQKIDVCYLDTTYLNPKYAFPSQERVITACADMCVSLNRHTVDETDGWEQMKRQRAGEGMVKFIQKDTSSKVKQETDEDEATKNDMKVESNPHAKQQILSSTNSKSGRGRLLVVVGTYSIGKERICVGIAKALGSKIYAPPGKQRIVTALQDPELDALMTTDPRAAQVHMTPLFEIRAETLDDYLKDYFPHYTRAVGFRPSGWNYRPPNTRFLESPSVTTVLNGENWKSTYSMKDLVPQRGSTSRASCFGVPYSEHSSFRELSMFCCALRIEKIIPTVNVGNAKSRQRMKVWCERWIQERRKNGPWEPPADGSWS